MKKLGILVLFVLASAVTTLGGRYYSYVTRGDDLYGEIGISLAQWMPNPVRSWGCGKLNERFPRSVAPYGCTEVWRRS